MLAEDQNFLVREANELLVGLIGIGLTLTVQGIAAAWRNYFLQKKFPVAGRYLTKYFDQGAIHSDMVELKQSGRRITGESLPNTERNVTSRKWIFEGEVKAEGYVQGSYKPEAFTDKGFGAFFLRFEKNGDMKGYWIGKDADESHIVSGEYIFLRQPAFTVAPIETSDVTQVLKIAEERLGDAYIDPADLAVNDRTIAFCARIQETVVAFATARMMESEPFLRKIRDRTSTHPVSLLPLERRIGSEASIGFVASAATDERFEGRGLGADLIEHCIEALEMRGANLLIATAWKSSKGIQAGSILECRGFQRLIEIPNYWESDSILHGYSCPTCGAPPCRCSAIIYTRSRHQKVKARR